MVWKENKSLLKIICSGIASQQARGAAAETTPAYFIEPIFMSPIKFLSVYFNIGGTLVT